MTAAETSFKREPALRIFACGTLVEIEEIETGSTNFVKARIADPTGAVNIMAGQYQPEVASILRTLSDNTPEIAESHVLLNQTMDISGLYSHLFCY